MTVDQFARDNPGPTLYRGVWVEEYSEHGEIKRHRVYTKAYAVKGFAKGEITKRLNSKYRQNYVVTETWVEVIAPVDITEHRIIT